MTLRASSMGYRKCQRQEGKFMEGDLKKSEWGFQGEILDQVALKSAIYKEEDTDPDEEIFDDRHSMGVQPNQSGYWFSNLHHKRKV